MRMREARLVLRGISTESVLVPILHLTDFVAEGDSHSPQQRSESMDHLFTPEVVKAITTIPGKPRTEAQAREDLAKALPIAKAAADGTGDIYTGEFKTIMELVNGAVSQAWSDWYGELTKGDSQEMKDLHWRMYTQANRPTSNNIEGYPKRAAKVAGVSPEQVEAITKAFAPYVPIVKFMAELRKKVKSGRRPATGPRSKDYVPPTSSPDTMKHVDAVVKTVTDELYQSMVDNHEQYFTSIVEGYFRDRKSETEDIYDFAHRMHMGTGGRDVVRAVLKMPNSLSFRKEPIGRKDDWKEIIHKLAVRAADDVRDNYTRKMVRKLSSIIDAKGNFDDAKSLYLRTHSYTFVGEVQVTFKDGTHFTIRNSAVMKTSNRGNVFYQFPSTFHDVVGTDGKTHAKLSEEEMNTVFLGKPLVKESMSVDSFNDIEGKVPSSVLEAARALYGKVAGKTKLCGDSKVVDGWWIETHTLGCRNQADEAEENWESSHRKILHEYEDDAISLVVVPEEFIFITLTPQKKES